MASASAWTACGPPNGHGNGSGSAAAPAAPRFLSLLFGSLASPRSLVRLAPRTLVVDLLPGDPYRTSATRPHKVNRLSNQRQRHFHVPPYFGSMDHVVVG